MQDSTSPEHEGFQVWTGNETRLEQINHIAGEIIRPGTGSKLDLITYRAWTAFTNNSIYGFVIN